MPEVAFDALGEAMRRRILELLADGERTAGQVAEALGARFDISQPAVSQHLRVLREAGLVTVRPEGNRRFYGVDETGMRTMRAWLARFGDHFTRPLDALETELARGRRERRLEAEGAEGTERARRRRPKRRRGPAA